MKMGGLNEMLDVMGWDDVVKAMDPEIVEEIHRDFTPASWGEFYAVYSQLHLRKYGRDFEVKV